MKRYTILWLLLALFLASLLGQFYAHLQMFMQELQHTGEPFQWSAFLYELWAEIFANWQSEFLQLIFQFMFTAFLFWQFGKSAQTLKEEQEQQAIVREIREDVRWLMEERLLAVQAGHDRVHGETST